MTTVTSYALILAFFIHFYVVCEQINKRDKSFVELFDEYRFIVGRHPKAHVIVGIYCLLVSWVLMFIIHLPTLILLRVGPFQ